MTYAISQEDKEFIDKCNANYKKNKQDIEAAFDKQGIIISFPASYSKK